MPVGQPEPDDGQRSRSESAFASPPEVVVAPESAPLPRGRELGVVSRLIDDAVARAVKSAGMRP